jgi:hypothetical protein
MKREELEELYHTTCQMLDRSKLKKETLVRIIYETETDSMKFIGNKSGEYVVVYFDENKTKEKFFEYMEKANQQKKLGNMFDVIREWNKGTGDNNKKTRQSRTKSN